MKVLKFDVKLKRHSKLIRLFFLEISAFFAMAHSQKNGLPFMMTLKKWTLKLAACYSKFSPNFDGM